MRHYRQGWAKGWKKSPRGEAGEWFDSYWEVQYMDELDRDPLVVHWTRHHGIVIPYRKWWGGSGKYHPDFLVEMVGQKRALCEVKGEHLFKDGNTGRKLKAAEEYCRSHKMLFKVITKSKVDPALWGPPPQAVIFGETENTAVFVGESAYSSGAMGFMDIIKKIFRLE